MIPRPDYGALLHPDVPTRWRFCGHCGRPMGWAVEKLDSFSRETGKRLTRWVYECNAAQTLGGEHDIIPERTEIDPDIAGPIVDVGSLDPVVRP